MIQMLHWDFAVPPFETHQHKGLCASSHDNNHTHFLYEIYFNVTQPVSRSNRATCFGYGQTGAGKTHTLLGNDKEPGVFLYAAKDVLSRLSSHSVRQSRNGSRRGFTLYMSLYEIYCSRIFDLLNDHKK